MSYGVGTFGADDPNERKYRKFSDRELVRALLRYILSYRRNFSIVIVTLLITASVGVAGPSLLGFSLNDIVLKNLTGLVYLIAIFAALSILGYYAESKRTYHIQLLGQNVIYDLRRDAFGKLQQLSPSYYSNRETGRIMSYITNDVDAVSDFVTFQLPGVLSGVVVIISIIIIMFLYNVNLSLVSLTVIPPLVALTMAMQGRIQLSFVETRKKIAQVTAKLQEGISGVRVTQSLAKEDRVNENFDVANSENLEANLKANRLTSLFNSLIQVIQAGGISSRPLVRGNGGAQRPDISGRPFHLPSLRELLLRSDNPAHHLLQLLPVCGNGVGQGLAGAEFGCFSKGGKFSSEDGSVICLCNQIRERNLWLRGRSASAEPCEF